jgi:uncharacterized protein
MNDVLHSAPAARVAAIATTAVKGCALSAHEAVSVGFSGLVGDRMYFLVDDTGSMVNGKALGNLVTVHAEADGARLTLRFPDGSHVSGDVAIGTEIDVRYFRSGFAAPTVIGPWSDALSEYCGRSLRLCQAPAARPGVDRGVRGAVTVMCRESLDALAAAGGLADPVDGRRFRMNFTVDGAGAHADDGWVGSRVAIGGAVIRVTGLVGRCAVTTRDPESGAVDLPTLHILKGYRGDVPSDEGLPFGVYGHVVDVGAVRVGDEVRVLGP